MLLAKPRPGALKSILAGAAVAWGTSIASKQVADAAERLDGLERAITDREERLTALRVERMNLGDEIAELRAENRRLLDLSPVEAEAGEQNPEAD